MCSSALTESVDGFYLLLMNFDKLYRSIRKTKHSQVEEKREREETFTKPPSSLRQILEIHLKNLKILNSSVLNLWFNPNMSFKVWYRYSYYSSHYLIFLNVKNEIIQLFFSCEGKKLQRNVTQCFSSNFVCVKSCFINNIMLHC